jgi:Uma2 family endonuclease
MRTAAAEANLVLGPEMADTLMTPAEFDAVSDWDEEYRYELIHGVLIVNPLPSPEETAPNEELGYLLRYYQEFHPQGSAQDLTLAEQFVRTRHSRRRADRLIWAGLGRPPRVNRDLPRVAVEFVSWGKRNRYRDYVERRREYAELGIGEYWLIDRFQRIMTVFRLKGPKRVVKEHETYRTPLLPGFELPLARLLAVADRLGEAE